MNLQEANLAYENYMAQLMTATQHGTRDDVVQLVLSSYPKEAVDYLTRTGAPILIIYYALVAFGLYKAIGRLRYIYRFLISLAVFAFAVCVDFVVAGLNVMGLEYALGFGFKVGSIAAVIGLLFSSFYKKPERKEASNTETQNSASS